MKFKPVLTPLFALLMLLVLLNLSACLTPMDTARRISFLGAPATMPVADRTVNIEPSTSYVNVTGGEIIGFTVGGKSFAWNFDGAGEYHFDLALVAPQGMLDHRVMAYVKTNPFTSGGR